MLSTVSNKSSHITTVPVNIVGTLIFNEHPGGKMMLSWIREANLCLALAVQYFKDLSGSLTWPSLQHCPHTNFIFRFRPRPRPHPTSPPPPPPPVLPPPMQSPPTPPETTALPLTALLLLLLPLGWCGPSMGWRRRWRKKDLFCKSDLNQQKAIKWKD